MPLPLHTPSSSLSTPTKKKVHIDGVMVQLERALQQYCKIMGLK